VAGIQRIYNFCKRPLYSYEGDLVSTLRSKIITRRTYSRPLNKEGSEFETWEQIVERVILHQAWLWDRALGKCSSDYADICDELKELRQLLLEKKVSVSGRTLWLGGTKISKEREASQFNCSFTKVETVHDVVDVLWLLLQGCGVGFKPQVGTLSGFAEYIPNIKVIRSKRTDKGGDENNNEKFNNANKEWRIKFGDSAEAWAKSVGKLLSGKHRASTLVLDFSELRPAGERLSGYGWISAGDEQISNAFERVAFILNKRAGQLLTRIDILDIVNWLGTILSSRRSAEIALVDYNSPEWEEFARAKKDYWEENPQRGQSNNSLIFWNKPSREELENIFDIMLDNGGSEPGFINGDVARDRAPWFSGVNPCAEILLGNKSFCNLTEVNLVAFKDDHSGLERAVYLAARANYRQTLVNLDDGILQRTWHENNEFLRLCGVSITGLARCNNVTSFDFRRLSNVAVYGAYSIADELHTPRPKNVTTIKPSGTLSKIMDTTEGVHKPLGRYILNNINFSKHDPLVPLLKQAGYRVWPNPTDPSGTLVTFPVEWDDVEFDIVDGKYVNNDSAITQLESYKSIMESYVDHNCSITVSYDKAEIPEIIDWIVDNWQYYVGVSFLLRNDPSKTAKDLGYLYLPQEVVTKEEYDEYVSGLEDVDLESANSFEEILDEECSTGACPTK
jgi:ribonucleoside-triphosphate reductase (formate)